MKTPTFNFLAMIIPPTALLLCDCASTGSTQPQPSGSRAPPEIYRREVSFHSPLGDPFEILKNMNQSDTERNESAWFTPWISTFSEPEEPNPVSVAPLVVTATRLPDDSIKDWPSDVVDAELKATWISHETPEPSRGNAMEDSVSEWLRSLR